MIELGPRESFDFIGLGIMIFNPFTFISVFNDFSETASI